MLRKTVRILATMSLLVSLAFGVRALSVWLTPSDEQQTYEKKFQEATEKVKRVEAARGTPAEARLAEEAKAALASVDIWRRALSDRLWWNRMGVIASFGIAFLSLVMLLLTFIKRKPPVELVHPNGWSTHNPNLNYGGQSNFDNPQLPRR